MEFDFAYSWSCLPWRVFQQHLTSKSVLTNPSFLCLKEQRIIQIFPGVHHRLLCIKLQVICWAFRLLPGICCSSPECKTAPAMPFLTWKCCFSCGSCGKSFLTGPLLSIKYPFYHEATFLCPSTAWCFHLAGKETSWPHPEEASNTGTDIRVIFSDWWLRFYPSAAVYEPSGLILWTFPVPKVVLSIFVPFASGRTRSIKTRSFAGREWCCPSMFFLLVRNRGI